MAIFTFAPDDIGDYAHPKIYYSDLYLQEEASANFTKEKLNIYTKAIGFNKIDAIDENNEASI